MTTSRVVFLIAILLVAPLLAVAAEGDEPRDMFPMKDGEVTYEKVVEVEGGATAQALFDAVRGWSASGGNLFYRKLGGDVSMAATLSGSKVSPEVTALESNYRGANPVVYEKAPESIAFKVVQHYQAKQTRSCVRTLFVESTLRIDVKDGKYRYRLSGFSFNHWNHFVGEQQPIWATKAVAETCGISGTLEQLQMCPKCEKWVDVALTALADDAQALVAQIEEEIAENLGGDAEDDW